VFCGATPEKETKEHVIPRWLIELTGDPHRKGIFGPYWDNQKGELVNRSFAFDRFAFPACHVCNRKFSSLESSVNYVMREILNENALSSKQIGLFLSWLDKVRVGYWLIATFYLQKNPLAITPSFHVNWRVDASDRMILIYKSDYDLPRLAVEGCTTPAFQLSPSCFVLTVNNFTFLNVSTDFLISERLGLPYPTEISFTDDARIRFTIVEGRKRIRPPLVRLQYDQHCTQLFQPLFTRSDIRTTFPLYETEYVRSISEDHPKGIGKIFILNSPFVEEYPSDKVKMWIPKWKWNDEDLRKTVRKQWLEFQLRLIEYGPSDRKFSYTCVTRKQKKRLIETRTLIANLNEIRRIGHSCTVPRPHDHDENNIPTILTVQ